MHSSAVIGLGFGDEGKGKTTNFLCLSYPEALVIRHSGGPQAGHTVVLNGKRHIFSNFGSGTLNGNPTYWSPFCAVDPVGLYNEFSVLQKLGVNPFIFIDAKCPVITPADKYLNQILDRNTGTCGVGVGTTIQRELDHYSLLFEDLFYPTVLRIKLELINKYYHFDRKDALDKFFDSVYQIINLSNLMLSDGLPEGFEELIFESSQGLLLDQHYGFFPHVTRSNVGTHNIMQIYEEVPMMYAVTRAYQTRHGNGPMTNLDIPHNIKINPFETNVENEYQGVFKRSLLDVDLLQYAIDKDPILKQHKDVLVITCLDHIEEDLRFTYKGNIVKVESIKSFVSHIVSILDFSKVLISNTDLTPSLIEL